MRAMYAGSVDSAQEAHAEAGLLSRGSFARNKGPGPPPLRTDVEARAIAQHEHLVACTGQRGGEEEGMRAPAARQPGSLPTAKAPVAAMSSQAARMLAESLAVMWF